MIEMQIFTELSALFVVILSLYFRLFETIKEDIYYFGHIFQKSDSVQLFFEGLGDNIGQANLVYTNQNILSLLGNQSSIPADVKISSFQKLLVKLVTSSRFQLVAPVSLLCALIIIYASSNFDERDYESSASIIVSNDIISDPIPVSAAVSATSQNMKEFAAAKAMSLNENLVINTPDTAKRGRADEVGTPVSALTGDTHSIYSIDNTDDGLSQLSKLETVDKTLAIIMRQSKHDPKVLLGWKIIIKGRGEGVVVDIVRRWAMTTLFKVQFDSGKSELLPLKRSTHKGTVAFTPISKVA